jgi:hypothetical protein
MPPFKSSGSPEVDKVEALYGIIVGIIILILFGLIALLK